MSAKDFLPLLFDAIALSFFAIATLDFFTGLMQLWPDPLHRALSHTPIP